MKVESIITIYNRLTETKDLDTFKNILEYHYDKFKYFYRALEKCTSKEVISNITCNEATNDILEIIINTEKKNNMEEIINELMDNFKDSYFESYSLRTSIDKRKKIIILDLCNQEYY